MTYNVFGGTLSLTQSINQYGSSSSVCTLHIAEDDGLYQSVVTHSAHVSEEVQLSLHQPLAKISTSTPSRLLT